MTMKTDGTNETFQLKFLHFNHKDQRWRAECEIGDTVVVIAGAAGMEEWYVVDHPEVEVPKQLRHHLVLATRKALGDWHLLEKYKKAVGEYPPGVIQ